MKNSISNETLKNVSINSNSNENSNENSMVNENSNSSSTNTTKIISSNEENDTLILNKSKLNKIRIEPTRFPSLTFISQNTSLNDRETSIKNANLKSELIENNKQTKNSKESLFNTQQIINYDKDHSSQINLNDSIESPSISVNNSNFYNYSNINNNQSHVISKTSSINTLQTVYTDACSYIENDDNKSTTQRFNDNISNLYPTDFDEANSIYQQSLHSTNHDILQKNNNLTNNLNLNLNNINNNTNSNMKNGTIKEETESFIYNDINSVDILNFNDHKLQKKGSNVMVFQNPFGKDLNATNTNNNINHHRSNSTCITINTNTNDNNPNTNNEFDFLDNQSLSTIQTSNDYYLINNSSKSPTSKRFISQQQNIPLSPTYSKVRQVSQKIFPNFNAFSVNNYSKINLDKRNNFRLIPNDFNEQQNNLLPSDFDNNNDNEILEEIHEEENITFPNINSINNKSKLLRKYNNSNLKTYNNQKRNNEINYKKNNSQSNQQFIDYGSTHDNYSRYYDSVDDYIEREDSIYNKRNSPHDYKSMYYRQSMILNFLISGIYIFIALLLLFSFIKIFIMKTFDNSLNNFEFLNLENVLISDEILLIDINSRAVNINFQDINIWNMDFNIFLITDESNLMEISDDNKIYYSNSKNDITILLGNINRFLTPLRFNGIVDSSNWKEIWEKWWDSKNINPQISKAQLKMYNPGKDFSFNDSKLTHEQWLKILNSDYKIILRGNLEYSLPLVWQKQFISISAEIDIKPETNN